MALCSSPVVAATTRPGLTQGDWLIRAGAARITPMEMRSNIPLIDGTVETPDVVSPTLDLSYFLTDHWALQLAGGVSSTRYRVADSMLSDFDVGTIKTAAIALMAQYHFRPGASLNPYLGVGMVRSHTLRVDPADHIPDFEVEDINSMLLGAGLDYHLGGHWFANAAIQYLKVPTYQFKGEGFSAEVDMDTLITGLGLGYRF
ncbi:OmpW/AlkL family protein [Kushneria pakistanensis]|nr:OmpW family outer membrane protein [Kushneria pakistanensis]